MRLAGLVELGEELVNAEVKQLGPCPVVDLVTHPVLLFEVRDCCNELTAAWVEASRSCCVAKTYVEEDCLPALRDKNTITVGDHRKDQVFRPNILKGHKDREREREGSGGGRKGVQVVR